MIHKQAPVDELTMKDDSYLPFTSGPLVLYQKHDSMPRITEITDNEDTDSLTSSESDNDDMFEPMDLD